MTNFRAPSTTCPNCHESITGAGVVVEEEVRPPEPGDIAICFYCRHIAIYDDALQIRDPTDAEVVEIAGDPEIIFAMKMFQEYDRWKASKG
jgi:hypothetical protein